MTVTGLRELEGSVGEAMFPLGTGTPKAKAFLGGKPPMQNRKESTTVAYNTCRVKCGQIPFTQW